MELLAWRTLGEGLLLIDMYEQGGQAHSEPPPREARRPQGLWARALNWWGRARHEGRHKCFVVRMHMPALLFWFWFSVPGG